MCGRRVLCIVYLWNFAVVSCNVPNFCFQHFDLRKKLAETYCVAHSWSSPCLVFLVRPVFGRGGKFSQSIFSCIPGCGVVTFPESTWGRSEEVPFIYDDERV